MIGDLRTTFASATALSTAGTGRALVGNVMDLEVARDIGQADGLYLVVEISSAVTSAGAATVAFELSSDAQAAIATDGSESIHFTTAAFPKASLVAGFVAAMLQLPFQRNTPYERYLGIEQNVGTAALTAGAINAFLTPTVAAWKSYNDGVPQGL